MPHRWIGCHAAAVVGHQDGTGILDRDPGAGRQLALVRRPIAGIEPDNRLAACANPCLAHCFAVQFDGVHFGVRRQHGSELATGVVVGEGGDDHHPIGRLGSEYGRQAGTTRTARVGPDVDDGHRGVGTDPVGESVDVGVEQDVADDHQVPGHERAASALSKPVHRACTSTR